MVAAVPAACPARFTATIHGAESSLCGAQFLYREHSFVSDVDVMSGTRLEPYAPAGVGTVPERTLLTERAADYLKGGPADSRSLIGHFRIGIP